MKIDNNHQYNKSFAHSITERFSFYGILDAKMSHCCYMLHIEEWIVGKIFLFSLKGDTKLVLVLLASQAASTNITTLPKASKYCAQIDIKSLIVQFNLCISSNEGEREKSHFNKKFMLHIYMHAT